MYNKFWHYFDNQENALNKTGVKVNNSQEFRQKAAECILEELCGSVRAGIYFVDCYTWKIYFRNYDAPWHPWAGLIPLTDLTPGAIVVQDWAVPEKRKIDFILKMFLVDIDF